MSEEKKNMRQDIEKAAQAAVDHAVRQQLAVQDDGPFAYLMDTARFNHLWRVAATFSKSDMIPAHYQGKPENCLIAMQMATRLNVDPFMFMQNTYIVHGRPGMEAKLATALINMRGPFDGPIQYKFEGEGSDKACTAYAVHKRTRETCSATVTWKMVEAEGWNKKQGSKWLTMPDLMFQYRSAMFLGRLYAPECLMGMQTVDELQDIGTIHVESRELPDIEGDFDPPKEENGQRTEKVKQKMKARRKPKEPEPEPVPETPPQNSTTITPSPPRQIFINMMEVKCKELDVEWQDDTLINDIVLLLKEEKDITEEFLENEIDLPDCDMNENDERWYTLEAAIHRMGDVVPLVKKALHFRQGAMKF